MTTASIRRITGNSRGPGQDDVVPTRFVGLCVCADCGRLVSRSVPLGRHSARWNEWGELVNCVGQVVPRLGVRR